MRIEIEPARVDPHAPPPDAGRSDPGRDRWSEEDIARLRSEWDLEPGHR